MSFPNADLPSVELLAQESRRYGADSTLVIAGGGNTSWKTRESLYVKASGRTLATIGADGFVRMLRSKLEPFWDRKYPADQDQREAAVLADILGARAAGEENKRPSVETLLHELFPNPWVFHMHPTLVNALTCAVNGQTAAAELFDGDVLWIPPIEPGLILARRIRNDALIYEQQTGRFPRTVFLENHGVFVAGNTIAEVRQTYDTILQTLGRRIGFSNQLGREWTGPAADSLIEKWQQLADNELHFKSWVGEETLRYADSEEAFQVLEHAPTPDHVVYAGHRALRIDNPEDITHAYQDFVDAEGVPPYVVLLKGRGYLAAGTTEDKAAKARDIFLDQIAIASAAETFGGMKPLPPSLTDFIRNWEVEKFRASLPEEKGTGSGHR